jgi:GNAT superfamily N-acetyltransferase
MDIIEVTHDDSALVDDVVELYAAVDAVDCPWHNGLTVRTLRTLLALGWDGDPFRFYAGVLDGRVMAASELYLPTRDNLDNAWFRAAAHPQRRRKGLGSRLLDHVEAIAAEAGRTVLGVDAIDTDAARGFAAARAYELKYVGVYRRLTIADVPQDVLDTAYQDGLAAAAADYDLVRIAGRLTDAQLEDTLAVVSAINDAPTDDLVLEDEVWDPRRLRAYDEAQADRGMRMYRVWARHRGTGEIAGHTVVAVEEERPQLGEQHDTTVLPKHRGHRLGLLLKADMMRWLRDAEPRLETITTDNAGSNSHMIAVNERLGYQVVGRSLEYQRPAG